MREQTALSGRELARARRAMLAQGGKNGVANRGARPSRSPVPTPARFAPLPVPVEGMPAEDVSATADTTPTGAELDALCEIVEQNPAALGADANSVRQFCRNRRRALSSRGKSAMLGKPDMHSRLPGVDAAPAKVEVGAALSGQTMMGTQVERTVRSVGNEPGACRVAIGMDHIDTEQFDTFCGCGVRPVPAVAKVGISATSRGQWVSGTGIGHAVQVTGDEAGVCKTVTGTEYLGREHFAEFCQSKGLLERPVKVSVGTTERKGIAVTGSDEARANGVTGAEPGAKRVITGSQYADAGAARLTINGPHKVALTHTLAGRPVSGTEVGRSVKMTGDKAGSCRVITGTEYLSNEQFVSICNTRPEPAPAKVGEDASEGGQRITGNLVDRTEKVTGNEPGSCQRVTGAQYGSPALCGGGAEQVAEVRTLADRTLTGNRADHGLKLNGDERGRHQPSTGTEYDGREHDAMYCSGTPAPAAKAGISRSDHRLAVSGTMLGRSRRVTGNEPGSGLAISGTPYAGREQVTATCGGCETKAVIAATSPAVARRHPRYLAPADQPMLHPTSVMRSESPRPEDFSIVSPARYAQSMRERITGNTYGSGGCITGPVNMAAGLVSGTPEFRYRDEVPRVQTAQPEGVLQPLRITGEGGEAGTRITGDDWARSNRVTGTEGRWAQGRNPTLRGETRTIATGGARVNKGRERPEVPMPRITGSSGTDTKGAVVTLSGGARG